jgi:hypothetical protein
MGKLVKLFLLLSFLMAGVSMNAFAKKAEVESTAAPSGTILINVLMDNNVAGLDERQTRSQNEIGDFMADDLIRVIARYSKKGFEGKVLADDKGLKMADSQYLLKVKIVKYHAGSTAARMIGGFGAGACSMDVSYELLDSKSKVVLAKDDGVGSAGDWRRVARKLNEKITKAVTEEINKTK